MQLGVSGVAQSVVCNVAPYCSLSAPVDARWATWPSRARGARQLGSVRCLVKAGVVVACRRGARCCMGRRRQERSRVTGDKRIKNQDNGIQSSLLIVWSFRPPQSAGTSLASLSATANHILPRHPRQDHYVYTTGVSLYSADAHVLDRSWFPARKTTTSPICCPGVRSSPAVAFTLLSRLAFFDFL